MRTNIAADANGARRVYRAAATSTSGAPVAWWGTVSSVTTPATRAHDQPSTAGNIAFRQRHTLIFVKGARQQTRLRQDEDLWCTHVPAEPAGSAMRTARKSTPERARCTSWPTPADMADTHGEKCKSPASEATRQSSPGLVAPLTCPARAGNSARHRSVKLKCARGSPGAKAQATRASKRCSNRNSPRNVDDASPQSSLATR